MRLAREALTAGGGTPAILNAANEVAVGAFLEGKISFPEIVHVVSDAVAAAGRVPGPGTLDEAEDIDRMGRRIASGIVRNFAGVAT